jgi:uncharacterized protein (DUF2235 family)
MSTAHDEEIPESMYQKVLRRKENELTTLSERAKELEQLCQDRLETTIKWRKSFDTAITAYDKEWQRAEAAESTNTSLIATIKECGVIHGELRAKAKQLSEGVLQCDVLRNHPAWEIASEIMKGAKQ